ncbi:MAG: InlB B-repeat-containing protein [Paludibacteraceae bacterium]|nr:InlB B-repeat-containing protein [Paludibacteraceae bacterium]
MIKEASASTSDITAVYSATQNQDAKALFTGIKSNDDSRQALWCYDKTEGGSSLLYTSSSYTTSKSNTTDIPIYYDADKTTILPAGTYILWIDCNSSSGNTIDALTFTSAGFSITYDCDGAESGCPENVSTTMALPNPLPAAPIKTGYTFGGWFTDDDFAAEHAAVAGASLSANTTLYAKWTAKTTTINLKANGGSADGTVTATYGQSLPSFTALSYTGHDLLGYFTAETEGTKIINADGSLVANTDYADADSKWKSENTPLSLYAQWQVEAAKHAIFYDNLNGASVDGYPTQYAEGIGVASFAPLADTDDFHFTGWSPASIDATATDDPFVVTAQWSDKFTVTYNANGGSNPPTDANKYYQGQEVTLAAATGMTAPTNKVFKEWVSDDVAISEGKFAMPDKAVTIKAKWANGPLDIIRIDLTGQTTFDVTGIIGGTGAVYKLSSSADASGGYKLNDGTLSYIGVTLAEGYFQPGDKVIAYCTGAASKKMSVFSGTTDASFIGDNSANWVVGENTFTLPNNLGKNINSIYLVRTSTYGQNPFIKSVRVVREGVVTYAVTYSAGEGSGDVPASFELIEGKKFIVAEGSDMTHPENMDFDYWSVSGITGVTTAMPEDELTMGTADVTLTAQWKEHVTSTDATLKSLKVNGNDVELQEGVFEYSYTLPFGTTDIPTVVAVANDNYATVADPVVSLTQATITVTPESGEGDAKTYTINFTVKQTLDLEMVWDKSKKRCDGTTPSAVVKSTDDPIKNYLSISFTGGGAEGSSLNTSNNADGSLTITAKDGYVLESMSGFFGKLQANCEYSIDGGAHWETITTTSTSGDKCYSDIFADAIAKSFILRNTAANGAWIRNMQLAIAIEPAKHNITYEETKESDMTAYPTFYYEGVGIEEFAALNDVTGFHFDGWNPASIAPETTEDVTVTALWTPAYDVIYKYGEEQIGSEAVIDGGQTAKYADFQKQPMKVFAGWYSDPSCEDAYAVEMPVSVTENTTFYGKWNIAFAQTIDFEANAGASSLDETFWTSKNYAMSSTTGVSWDNNSKYADKGLKIKNNGTKLEFYVPANKLMIFKVGSTSGAKFDGTALTTSTSNVDFFNVVYDYATTDKKHTYQTTTGNYNILKSVTITDPFVIKYNVPEGADCDKTEDTFIGQSLTAPDATMEGKIFLGWYDAATGGNLIATANAPIFPTESMELFAQFRDINVEAVTNFAVTPTDDPFSVSLSWSIPGMVDVSQAMAPYQATTDPTDANPTLTVNADGSVDVTCQLGQYGNSGVGFPIASGVVKQISFEYKVDLPSSDCFVWGGAGVEAVKVNWQGKSTGKLTGDKADWTLAQCTMQENYWEGDMHTDADNQVAIYVNSDGTYTQSFSVRNIHYLIEGGESNDNQKVIVVRKADEASTGVDDGEKIYEGTNFFFQDNLTEAGTYYYTIYAVGPQDTYVASEPIKYEFAKIRDGLTNGKLVTMCQAQPIAKMWGGAAFDVEKKYSVGIVLIEANIDEEPLQAGKPYAVLAEAPEIYVLYAEGDAATIVAEANGLVGNLSTASGNLDVEGDNSYIFLDNHLYKASKDNGNYVAPDRAYLNYDNVEDHSELAAPTRRRLSMGGAERGQATGWDELMMNNGATKFIRNNQLFIIRDGKFFNAQGAKMR